MTINPLDQGAIADGSTVNTQSLQRCIDLCHQQGGGEVVLPAGVFVSGTLRMKSRVTLRLLAGAVLRASADLADFPSLPSVYPAYNGEFETHKMLLFAEDAEALAVVGEGILDGGGTHWKDGPYGNHSFALRPRIIYFRHCTRVRVRDVTLVNGAAWIQTYQSCSNLLIDGITVDSRENPDIEKERFADRRHLNTDGLDVVDSQQVRISNCFIRTGDDGICLKSFSPDEACRDITITNCVITTNASGIKIGTESAGAFTDITISNCTVYDTRCEGIALLTTDGARLERVIVSNICMRNIKGAAIAVRLGNRNHTYRKDAVVEQGSLSDVLIENIQGVRLAAPYACSISGCAGNPVRRITLKNINLCFEGGFTEPVASEIADDPSAYPSGRMYGAMPVYGLLIKHAEDVKLDSVHLRTEKADPRPPFRFEQVTDLRVHDTPGAPLDFRL